MILCGDLQSEGLPILEKVELQETTTLTPKFTISYAEEKTNEYTYYKTTSRLCNITGKNELPRFSGNIKYEGEFELEEAGKYHLDLGQVGEAAEVFVNGKSAGCRLISPYSFDISNLLQVGKNELTVSVSNHNGYKKQDSFSQYLLFEPSGLLGPVMLKKM